MSASGCEPLAELRARVAALASASALRRVARELGRDPRRGAHSLARGCRRRAGEMERECRRFARLLVLRERLFADGAIRVAGVDEVGVGPLAGPVVAAAVVLPEHPRLSGLDDSKRLSREVRERLAGEIYAQAIAVGIAEVSASDIDRHNIYQASLIAMRLAVEALDPQPDHVLVDARHIPGIAFAQTAIVGGDGLDASIAAASIVAKVHRDALMAGFDREYPGYGFGRHKGYGTREHLSALRRLGATPLHRRSFAPVLQLPLL